MKRESASKTSEGARSAVSKTAGKKKTPKTSSPSKKSTSEPKRKARATGTKRSGKADQRATEDRTQRGTDAKKSARAKPTSSRPTAAKAKNAATRHTAGPTKGAGSRKTESARPAASAKGAAGKTKPDVKKATAPASAPRATKAAPGPKAAKTKVPRKATKTSKAPAAPRASRPRRLGDEDSLASAPIRADLTKAPVKDPVPATLDLDQLRDALRVPIRDSGLPRRIAHGAILPALLSEGRTDQLQGQIDWALEDRVPAYYLAESFLQSYLFVGFPRTINALSRLHEVTRSRRRGLGLSADPLHVPSEIPSLDRILGGPGDFGSALKGRRIRLAEGPPMHLESPGEGPGSFERYAREWWRRGSELCRSVYGSQYQRLRENLGRIHPELADWMVFEGYGKVLSRPVITPRERELWIIPLLMVQNVPEQLYSHIRGAKNLGVPLGRIRAVIWLASTVAGPGVFAQAHEMLAEIERRDGEQKRPRPRPGY